jgi:hypothetical protein
MGGYQVLSNGNEISSNIVNRFDPRTNTYLSNGANIPLAIDDHVQAVYKDSLIYLITGWSNTGNVPDVQIYDPANDNWLTGTPLPNNNTYKAFGASGTIIGNTIYYHGGASTGTNFPVQSTLRIGQIDPNNPTQIIWSSQLTNFKTYRSVCIPGSQNLTPFWLGGSEISYNFNGIAYNGSGGVPIKSSHLRFNGSTLDSVVISSGGYLPIDLRGIASFSNSFKYVAGGMLSGQIVSNKTFKIEITLVLSINMEQNSTTFQLYPNPTSEKVNLIFKSTKERTIRLVNVLGKEVLKTNTNNTTLPLDVSAYPKGIYFIKVEVDGNSNSQKIIIQ